MEKGLGERETSLGRKQGGGTKSGCPVLHLCLTRSTVWSLATVLSFFTASLPMFHDSRPLAINCGLQTRFTDKAIGHSLQQLGLTSMGHSRNPQPPTCPGYRQRTSSLAMHHSHGD